MDLVRNRPPRNAAEALDRLARKPGGPYGHARVYLNYGRWVADCAREHCTAAYRLQQNQAVLECSNCGAAAPVEWPADDFIDGLREIMLARPVPQTRNWYPQDHDIAVRHGVPHGQILVDLMDENIEHGCPAVITKRLLQSLGVPQAAQIAGDLDLRELT